MNRITTFIVGLFWLTSGLHAQVSLSAGYHHRSESYVNLGRHFTTAKGDYRIQDLFGIQISDQKKHVRYFAGISFLKETAVEFKIHRESYWGGTGSFHGSERNSSQHISFNGTNLKAGIERVFDGKSLLFSNVASSLSFGILLQADFSYGLHYGPVRTQTIEYMSNSQTQYGFVATSDTTVESPGELVRTTGLRGSFGLIVNRRLTYQSFFLHFSVSFGLMAGPRFTYPKDSYHEAEDNYNLTAEKPGRNYFLDTGISFGYVFPAKPKAQK